MTIRLPDRAAGRFGRVILGACLGLGIAAQLAQAAPIGLTAPISVAAAPFDLAATPGYRYWLARFNGTSSDVDEAAKIAYDSSGNIYVAGFGVMSGGPGGDYVIVKYSSTGTQLGPAASFNGAGSDNDDLVDMVVRGNYVYVTGYSDRLAGVPENYDIVTVKYDLDLNQQWVATYNGSGDGTDWGYALAVDASGNVYVVGQSPNASGNDDCVTIKYDAGGAQKWARRYNPYGLADGPTDVAVDSSGNVYVVGGSTRPGRASDAFLLRYSPTGALQWARRYDGAKHDDDFYRNVSVYRSTVYAAGGTIRTGRGLDYMTTKFDIHGRRLWTRFYDGPAHRDDLQRDLAVRGGNICVTGGSDGGSATNYGFLTVKYDWRGVRRWVRRYDRPCHGTDEGWAVSVDGLGRVFVAGLSNSSTAIDYLTIAYNPSGSTRWAKRYNNGGVNGIDQPADITVRGKGVYVTGTSDGGTGGNWDDFLTLKYAP